MKYIYGTALVASSLAAAQAADPANPLLSTTYDFLARASSTSEVLTLNLTNLIILLILKALIFGFGLFSFGGTGRSLDGASEVSVKKSDLTGGMCFLLYTSGFDNYLDCVKRSACEDPDTAKQYVTAVNFYLKAHKALGVGSFDEKYSNVYGGIQEALEVAYEGGDCARYSWN